MYSKGYINRDEAVMRSSNPAKMEKILGPVNPVNEVEIVQPPKRVKRGRR
jgi:hypothetical protein